MNKWVFEKEGLQLKVVFLYLNIFMTQNSIITRQMSAPYVPLNNPKSTKYKRSWAFRGPKLWLELPISFRREADQKKFKFLLKLKSLHDLETMVSVYN